MDLVCLSYNNYIIYIHRYYIYVNIYIYIYIGKETSEMISKYKKFSSALVSCIHFYVQLLVQLNNIDRIIFNYCFY